MLIKGFRWRKRRRSSAFFNRPTVEPEDHFRIFQLLQSVVDAVGRSVIPQIADVFEKLREA